jgi:hypothetical protein
MTGSDLRKVLAEIGFSQARLAQTLGLNIRTIARYCASEKPIPVVVRCAVFWVRETRKALGFVKEPAANGRADLAI